VQRQGQHGPLEAPAPAGRRLPACSGPAGSVGGNSESYAAAEDSDESCDAGDGDGDGWTRGTCKTGIGASTTSSTGFTRCLAIPPNPGICRIIICLILVFVCLLLLLIAFPPVLFFLILTVTDITMHKHQNKPSVALSGSPGRCSGSNCNMSWLAGTGDPARRSTPAASAVSVGLGRARSTANSPLATTKREYEHVCSILFRMSMSVPYLSISAQQICSTPMCLLQWLPRL
jgi:hypothetical protein